MQSNSEAYEAEDRCFRVSVARRLMLPHLADTDPQVLLWHVPTTVQRVNYVANLWTCNSTFATAAGMEVALTAGLRQWPDAMQM